MTTDIRFGFLAALAAGFVVFLSMIFLVFDMSGMAFYMSLVFLLGMLVLSSLAMGGIHRDQQWGWILLMFITLIILLFSYVVYVLRGVVEWLTLMVASSVILMIVGVINVGLADTKPSKKPALRVYHEVEKVEPYYPVEKVTIKAAPAKKKTPKGNFVASKFATTYHTPKCEWVDNIKRRNKIWFKTEAEAKKAKFKAHADCIKK